MSRKPIPDEGRVFLRRLGRAICEERRAQRLLQGQLGARAGIPGTRVGEIERGRVNTTVLRIAGIAGALGLRPSELFRRVEMVTQDVRTTELQRARIIEGLRRLAAHDLDVLAQFVRLMLSAGGER